MTKKEFKEICAKIDEMKHVGCPEKRAEFFVFMEDVIELLRKYISGEGKK